MSEISQHSFALLDVDCRLVDWDAGFAREFRFAPLTLEHGMPYADILRAAAADPIARQSFLDNSEVGTIDEFVAECLKGFGKNRTCRYRTAAGHIVQVDEYRTVSGGVCRATRDVTEEELTATAVASASANRLLDAGDSDLGSALVEIRRRPDGSYIFPPMTDDVRRLLDLSSDTRNGDAMMVHARMNASPERDGKLLAAIEHSAETMEICALEYSVWDGKNRLRWIRQSMMPRKEADGGIVFSGVMRDVTREKEAEDQVELLRSVVVQSTDAIGIFESSFGPAHGTKILYLNEKFIHLFGGSADALVGQPIESLRSLDLHRRGRELISAAVKRNDSAPFDYEVLGADGHSFWVEVRITKVQGLERDGTRWVAISHDITERRHSLDELTRAKDAAEAGSRAKGAFLAAMSHELRSPLNAIIGFTEIIQAGVARAGWIPPYAEYLSDISESGRHLLHLINTILDLSRIESGQLVLNREPIDPGELLRAALAQSAASARDGDIAVTARIPLDCPRIEGDYLKLKQMLLNIVSNAIKFTPVGGKIDVSLNFTETEALIAVTDTGCGIPVGDLERVMLPFVQVGSTMSRKFEGSGLGLPIARSLCALHGGTLEIGSVEGQGTKVLISLPLLEAGAQELGASPEKPRPLADAAAA